MSNRTKFLLTGGLAGIINGLFGGGGGMLLVPLLAGWCGLPQEKAFATSVAIIFPLSLASALVYLTGGALTLHDALPYLIGGAAGGALAGKCFGRLSMVWLRRIFGLLLLYGGLRAVLAG